MRNMLIVVGLIILLALLLKADDKFYTYFNGKPAAVEDEFQRLNGAL